MAIHPITLDTLAPAELALQEPLSEALVRELLTRTKSSGAALMGATLLLWLIVRSWSGPAVGGLFLVLVGLTVVRSMGALWIERRAGAVFPYRGAFWAFLVMGALVGAALAALVLVMFPRLPPLSLAMCLVVIVGIDFGAMVALAASPLVFLVYVLPNAVALIAVSFAYPVRGFEHVFQAMQLVFTGALLVMSRSVQRSLRNNLVLRLQLGQSLAELQEAQVRLVEASRRAGRADVATAVIHNVGNVLTSVTVSASVVTGMIGSWRSAGLARLAALIGEQRGDLAGFFRDDPRGQKVPTYLTQVVDAIDRDRQAAVDELATLSRNIEHIRVIVRSQEVEVQPAEVAEAVVVPALLEDAIAFSAVGHAPHSIAVVRRFDELPPVQLDRHKALQIVMNLLANARDAVLVREPGERRISVGAARAATGELEIAIEDNGCGIEAANLPRVFTLGFTTKVSGHGLGLHYSACAARELGGNLTASSAGRGRGAVFRLVLPLRSAVGREARGAPELGRAG